MNKMVQSLWYGIGSFLPGILLVFTVVVAFIMTLMGDESIPVIVGLPFVLIAFLAAALCWFYIITMMIDAVKHSKGGMLFLWCVLLYMCNIFVFPIYWFVCVRTRTNQF